MQPTSPANKIVFQVDSFDFDSISKHFVANAVALDFVQFDAVLEIDAQLARIGKTSLTRHLSVQILAKVVQKYFVFALLSLMFAGKRRAVRSVGAGLRWIERTLSLRQQNARQNRLLLNPFGVQCHHWLALIFAQPQRTQAGDGEQRNRQM